MPLVKYLKKKGLKIFDVEEKDIHGGSLRIFITKNNDFNVQKRLLNLIKLEKKAKLNNLDVLQKFSKKVRDNRFEITSILTNLKKKNKQIAVLSTPAKGMTLLNYCKLDKDFINFSTEKSKLKINKFTPGTNIKVYSDKEILRKKPDYALILAWNFKKEIMNNNKKFYDEGGKFIIPIPKVRIIGKNEKN